MAPSWLNAVFRDAWAEGSRLHLLDSVECNVQNAKLRILRHGNRSGRAEESCEAQLRGSDFGFHLPQTSRPLSNLACSTSLTKRKRKEKKNKGNYSRQAVLLVRLLCRVCSCFGPAFRLFGRVLRLRVLFGE